MPSRTSYGRGTSHGTCCPTSPPSEIAFGRGAATAKSLYVQTEHFPYASLLSRSHSKVLAIGIEADGLLRELVCSAAFDERVLVVTESQAEAPRGTERCAPEAARPRTLAERFDIVFTDDARCDLAPGVRHVEIVSDTRHRTGDDTEVDFVFATGPGHQVPHVQ